MNRRVIVVDDSLSITRQIVNLVETIEGFEVVGTAVDGGAALKLFSEKKPDLVLLDLVMPVMDGLACLRAIMQIDPGAKVIMVSSLGGMSRKVEDSLKLGARNVISKPFDHDMVRDILERAFDEE